MKPGEIELAEMVAEVAVEHYKRMRKQMLIWRTAAILITAALGVVLWMSA